MRIPGTPPQSSGLRGWKRQRGVGDSENPRDSLSPQDLSDQEMGKTERLQCVWFRGQ